MSSSKETSKFNFIVNNNYNIELSTISSENGGEGTIRRIKYSVFWSFYFMYSQTLQLCRLRARIHKSHPTRVIQYISLVSGPLEALAYRLRIVIFFPESLSRRSLAIYSVCISVRVYKYVSFLLFFLFTVEARCAQYILRSYVDWSGWYLSPSLSRILETPADPDSFVLEFEKICSIIYLQRKAWTW